jgi:NAD(P)-dependent dehydrogenase (short-subunit alcohol dehydrogenase family)
MSRPFGRENSGNKDVPVVIITGASRGLGAACARLAFRTEAAVVLCARSAEKLSNLADEILDEGGTTLAVSADVSIADDCRRIVEAANSRFGRIDALINNAGVLEPIAPVSHGEISEWLNNLKINFLGAVMMVKACIPYMREQSGRVINVSSGAAINPIPGWGAYCSSKAALNQFTRVLAAEEKKITSIAFRPGVIDTEMQAIIRKQGHTGMQEDDHRNFVTLHSEGKLLAPEMPARALVALSLYAPRELSGEFIAWDDDVVKDLISQHFS